MSLVVEEGRRREEGVCETFEVNGELSFCVRNVSGGRKAAYLLVSRRTTPGSVVCQKRRCSAVHGVCKRQQSVVGLSMGMRWMMSHHAG